MMRISLVIWKKNIKNFYNISIFYNIFFKKNILWIVHSIKNSNKMDSLKIYAFDIIFIIFFFWKFNESEYCEIQFKQKKMTNKEDIRVEI